MKLFIGYSRRRHHISPEDLDEMVSFFSCKPSAVPAEFSDLAKQIMTNEGWKTPTNNANALDLYTKLVCAVNSLAPVDADE